MIHADGSNTVILYHSRSRLIRSRLAESTLTEDELLDWAEKFTLDEYGHRWTYMKSETQLRKDKTFQQILKALEQYPKLKEKTQLHAEIIKGMLEEYEEMLKKFIQVLGSVENDYNREQVVEYQEQYREKIPYRLSEKTESVILETEKLKAENEELKRKYDLVLKGQTEEVVRLSNQAHKLQQENNQLKQLKQRVKGLPIDTMIQLCQNNSTILSGNLAYILQQLLELQQLLNDK